MAIKLQRMCVKMLLCLELSAQSVVLPFHHSYGSHKKYCLLIAFWTASCMVGSVRNARINETK